MSEKQTPGNKLTLQNVLWKLSLFGSIIVVAIAFLRMLMSHQ